MEVRITGRHGDLTDQLKAYVEEKLEPLSRYYQRTRFLEVILDGDHLGKSVEVKAHLQRGAPLVVSVRHKDLFAAVDLAHDKLERLLTRRKEKVAERRKGRGEQGAASEAGAGAARTDGEGRGEEEE